MQLARHEHRTVSRQVFRHDCRAPRRTIRRLYAVATGPGSAHVAYDSSADVQQLSRIRTILLAVDDSSVSAGNDQSCQLASSRCLQQLHASINITYHSDLS
jgi:hypothetical protein